MPVKREKRKAKIMLIDNDIIQLTLLECMLRCAGNYNIVSYMNGLEAVQTILQSAVRRPDVIFASNDPSTFDAFEFADQLEDIFELNYEPKIYITTYGLNKRIEEKIPRSPNVHGVLLKPYSFQNISDLLVA